jgi:hypothetical protein
MEILEIVSYNQTEKITEVTFRLVNDDEDMLRTDVIENIYFEEFGFDYLVPMGDFLYDDEGEDQNNDSWDYIDEDDLKSFLDEYYVVYPEKLPNAEFE